MSTPNADSVSERPSDEELLERMKSMSLKEAKAHVKRKLKEQAAQIDSSGAQS